MLDDDIVFLGSTSHPPAVRPVTGIVLHVEKRGNVDGFSLTFRKANTTVVHIGRRSGFEVDKRSKDQEQSNAMFRCAVVSRKHAKIAFSDIGQAYLIDTGSHHGTHIRKPGDKFAKMLKSESPHLLGDGDIVTFGKPVGKGDECVFPVVARIELCYPGQPGTSFKPLVVPSPSSSEKSSGKSVSGRYGVKTSPASSSDESYSSNSGIYSDIEEISPPPSGSKPPASQHDSSSLGHAINVFKRLLPLPPVSHSNSGSKRLPSVSEIVERPLSRVSSFLFGPDSHSLDPALSLPPVSRRSSPVGLGTSPHDNDDSLGGRRSNSPMDLASPSPTPRVIVYNPLPIPPVPSHELNPPFLTSPPPFDANSLDILNSPEGSTSGRKTPVPEDQPAEAQPPSGPPPAAPLLDNSAQLRNIEETLERLQSEVNKLQIHKRKYKARFNSNVHVVTEKLAEFDDRLAEVNAEYTILFDQVDSMHHVDIPDMQEQLNGLQDRMDDFPSPFSTPEPAPRTKTPAPAPDLSEREDVKASIQALHALVEEMRTLRDTAQQEIDEQVVAIKAMRANEAAAMIARNLSRTEAAEASQTPVLTSLKRKRDDTDENGDEVVEAQAEAGGGANVTEENPERSGAAANDVMMMMMDGMAAPIPITDVGLAIQKPESPPPRKRARRFVRAMAQTATAVTIGAVVTWSALAFS
ncbi:hypothetical protein M413DRAFT_25557 [Hebeloma cylindrosporum]|uniref:FHA domain-containing protein n=1 Tax=Hebeloma cylindrosporum TaxID=76867 RepID=A0A0C3C5E3_HEBCY|nr:hypothetical protein M413DRAFT_25557 [Hebeloma cylindrosporum h7]